MAEDKIQRLSEGMDFFEDATSSVVLDYSELNESQISESESSKSPFKVIGVLKGQVQPLGEMSRNNRLYESDHWAVQLENLNFQERLRSRDLLGTIGHHDRPVTDADIAAGIVSHIVTVLEVREDKNGSPYLYGEMEILDTPAGRTLKALYEGGANLYVSSRAAGKLLPVAGQSYKLVDKNSFVVETFDIVRRPGFLKARPVFEGITESKPVSESEVKAANFKVVDEAVSVKKAEVSEVEELKGQIEQLAQIIEKVVNDVYEEETSESVVKEEVPESVIKEEAVSEVAENVKVKKELSSESLADFISLMSQTNISEDSFNKVLDIIEGKLN